MAEEQPEMTDFEEASRAERDGEEEEEEDVEEGEEEDDDDDDAEDELYTLRFENGMNPLDFVENDASGVLPYQQFERLEYEALAERKRKALQNRRGDKSSKKSKHEDVFGASIDEIMELMELGVRRKSRKCKKRGRRKGSKKKLSPEITKKLGDATLHYASGRYDEAVGLLKEVVLLAPNLPDPYHTLGLIYNALGDRKKSLNFYMIAAHLSPKDPSLWKLLVPQSIEQGNTGQVMYCLSKAITADPQDVNLRVDRALLYIKLGDYHKAAESYEQILGLNPEDIEALTKAAEFHQKSGHVGRAIKLLEEHIRDHPSVADLSVFNLLASKYMENNAYSKAIELIEHAKSAYGTGEDLPLFLSVNAGICHVHLNNMERAEAFFMCLQREKAEEQGNLITKVADCCMKFGHYESALKFYLLLEGTAGYDNGFLYLKVAQCYASMKERAKAIPFFYKVLSTAEDNVDSRVTLASLLLEEDKENEAIMLLSPPKDPGATGDNTLIGSNPWWLNGRVRMKLAQIYHAKGMLEAFVDAIFLCIHETLFIETINQKVKVPKRLPRRVLFERVKVLDDHQADNVFRGFRPIATASDLLKATRARKSLQKMEAVREERKAAALAAGLDWRSDDSDDEPLTKKREPPLPKLLKDEEHIQLVLNLCKALASLRRYWEALQIINNTLKLTDNTFFAEKEVLRSLGAQIAYNTTDPNHGYDYVRHIVREHPYSLSAWNCYYKVVSRLENRLSKHAKLLHSSMRRAGPTDHNTPMNISENQQTMIQQHEAAVKEYLQAYRVQQDGPRVESRLSKHGKFLHNMRVQRTDSVPPMIIAGHQLSTISQHQAAAKEYLEAYKVQPDNPFINLCAGTALINLALGFRLQNKHQCAVQGLAFLYNCLRICPNSQEALYNVARAYQQVGLFTLAAIYYEKVLAIHQKDYPIPKLPNEDCSFPENPKAGYCDLHMEAAYNLHLIYKKSGAFDLARQILRDHCTP
ncbi:hypothetical protein H6P81_007936 [Aristolochia fimbriata]|uniref:General transcription factor 3C polypeptide 3 n=1 Tax=Aristolochia fimbriata TaxID=158543 RepID=A0AAV7F1S1_ARIFI|nr:hypothetical protein H6P81_007936 [Aristolochia fimbriata]